MELFKIILFLIPIAMIVLNLGIAFLNWVDTYQYTHCDGILCMSFKDFKKYYDLELEKYKFQLESSPYFIVTKGGETKRYLIKFNFIDFYNYQIFYNDQQKLSKRSTYDKNMIIFLEAMQEEITLKRERLSKENREAVQKILEINGYLMEDDLNGKQSSNLSTGEQRLSE